LYPSMDISVHPHIISLYLSLWPGFPKHWGTFFSLVSSLVLALAVAQTFALPAQADAPDIGKAVAVKNEVTLEAGGSKQALAKGSALHQDEIIITGANSSAEVELLDKTKLAVGADAKIVLDKFVYDASASPASISVNLSKGAFRFITGIAPKASYDIKTPTASLGVRGTVFDVYVAENGETAVLLHEGGVQVCNAASACLTLDKAGHILHVGLAGAFSTLLRWDGSIMKGIGVVKAFPFAGKRLAIDPVRRLSPRALLRGTGSLERTIMAPAQKLRHILPTPGLPF
jgi:hypothetical protein